MTRQQATASIAIADYDYPLPDERIAAYPLADRDKCLLLVSAADGSISDRHFNEVPELLAPDTLLVCNNTRVINARIRFRKPTGAQIEVFLLEPVEPADYALMFQSKGRCRWQCLVGNLKRWKEGVLQKELPDGTVLRAERLAEAPGNAHVVEFTWDGDDTFAAIVEQAGFIPIPPYLRRESQQSDSSDYQTVYAHIMGSVAAPTAGLHFTPELLEQLKARGIEREELTLHVGAGTFQPVKSETIGEHPMHTETFAVTSALLKKLLEALESDRTIAAVGTTTVRTLESLPVIGQKLLDGDESLFAGQWDAYEMEDRINPRAALEALLRYTEEHGDLTASTAIMIAPGFRWRIVGALITNFHQPQSTLLLLVSSFLGSDERWKELYRHALEGDYRFLSYGDACLFYPPKP